MVLLAAGCSAAPDEDVGESAQNLNPWNWKARLVPLPPSPKVTMFSWDQTKPYSIYMMPLSEGFCALTAVAGHFVGERETTGVAQDQGYWVLGGTSLQDGVSAEATCVTYSSFYNVPGDGFDQTLPTLEAAYTGPGLHTLFHFQPGFGETEKDLAGMDSYCYLTKVGGRIASGVIELQPQTDRGMWGLHMDTYGFSEAITGSASCMRPWNRTYVRSTDPFGGYDLGSETVDLPLPPQSQAFCTLKSVSGAFEGAGDRIAIVRNPDGTQRLSRQHQASYLPHATATCVYYDQR
jgi:hypothetical protein